MSDLTLTLELIVALIAVVDGIFITFWLRLTK